MRRDRDAALIVNLRDRLIERHERLDRFVDSQREEVSLECCYLAAGKQLEAIFASRRQIARLIRSIEHIVIGDGDQVEIGLVLDEIEYLLHARHPVAMSSVDVNISFSHNRLCHFATPPHLSPWYGEGEVGLFVLPLIAFNPSQFQNGASTL